MTVAIVDGRLSTFLFPSPKRTDLEMDGRYAVHALFDPARPDEFLVRGRARIVGEPHRTDLARRWSFAVDDAYACFELTIDSAVLGRRTNASDWPPCYERWTAPAR